jgi:ABC-2 type transport system ATP-binding protein
MIEVQHLTKRYGPVTAVDDVSFRVEKGEILGFLGPNGAGKTSTMRVITGYMPASDGKVVVAGHGLQRSPCGEAHGLSARNAAALPRHDGAQYSTSRLHQPAGLQSGAPRPMRDEEGARTTWRTARWQAVQGYKQRVAGAGAYPRS